MILGLDVINDDAPRVHLCVRRKTGESEKVFTTVIESSEVDRLTFCDVPPHDAFYRVLDGVYVRVLYRGDVCAPLCDDVAFCDFLRRKKTLGE